MSIRARVANDNTVSCRKHFWTIIPPRVLEMGQRAGVLHPVWYAGATVNPYCMHCGVKRGDTVDDFRAESARRREREQNFDDLLWALLIVIAAVTLALIVVYGGNS